ncbi:MAG: malate synthase G, partial [Desulfovibrionaceae bacterium]|nr:malate synthase G [Desulfovibrionaceae bacterium]
MTPRTATCDLRVATPLYDFVNAEVLPDLGIAPDAFWRGFSAIVTELAPRNIALLAERERLQKELDTWHRANPGPIADMRA